MHYFSKFLKSKSLLIWIRRILENSEVVKKCFVKTFLENDWIFLFSQVWWVLHSRPPSRIFWFILEIYWKIETIIWVVGFLFKMMILLLFHCSKPCTQWQKFFKRGKKDIHSVSISNITFSDIFVPIFMSENMSLRNFLISWKLTDFYLVNGSFLEWS